MVGRRVFRWVASATGAVALATWVVSCGLDLDGTRSATDIDSSVGPDVFLPDTFTTFESGPGDASVDAPIQEAGRDGPVTCPDSGRGPSMQNLSDYCIDSTEVTVAQYSAFLSNLPDAAPPAFCTWNTDLYPRGWDAGGSTGGALPVRGVDWCDAWAFCQWAGKRLCGRIGGGSTPFSSFANPTLSQWMLACSGDAGAAYPYGNTYDASACVGEGRNAPLEAGSLASCEGAFPGLFDLSGNVFEWEDSCSAYAASGAQAAQCRLRGGAFSYGASAFRCDGDWTASRVPSVAVDPYVGFRCCAD